MNIQHAQESELAEVEAFYATFDYTGGALPADTVLITRNEAGLIGVVRLCEEFETLVLRGMYVERSQQRAGIGSALLAELSAEVGTRECWCIPYSHLGKFYGQIGFVETEPNAAPKFLSERHAGYLAEGGDMIVMVRPRDWSDDVASIQSTERAPTDES